MDAWIKFILGCLLPALLIATGFLLTKGSFSEDNPDFVFGKLLFSLAFIGGGCLLLSSFWRSMGQGQATDTLLRPLKPGHVYRILFCDIAQNLTEHKNKTYHVLLYDEVKSETLFYDLSSPPPERFTPNDRDGYLEIKQEKSVNS